MTKEERNDNIHFGLNLSATIILIACIVVGILNITQVIKIDFILPLIAMVFLVNIYVISIFEYHAEIIDKRRLLQHIVMYLIIFIIVLLYFLMTLFGE